MGGVIAVLVWGAAASAAAAVLYLWAWALVGLIPAFRRERRGAARSDGCPSFVIVVPAHNEEARLPALLEQLRRLAYPADRYETWVVADNCTDDTAGMAQREGARCLVRHDPDRVGKGWALRLAFEAACEAGADAVVVVDVDSTVSPNLLQAFAARLDAGPRSSQHSDGDPMRGHRQRALQASNRLVPGGTAQSLLLAAESVLEDRLFYGSKARAGLPVLLRGNGMCLATSLLRERPWEAFSLAEDVEYGAALLASGERPGYVDDAQVTSMAPLGSGQMVVQRSRWGRGHRRVLLRYGPGLLWKGIRALDLGLCDAAVGLFVTSKSALACLCAGSLAAAWALRGVVGDWPAWLSAAGVLALVCYGGLGLILCRPTWGRLVRALLSAPAVLALRALIHVRCAVSVRAPAWMRTPDHDEVGL